LGFLEMTAMEAVIRHQLGDREGAFGALKRAYDAARPNAIVMPFIELAEYMHSLINAALKSCSEKGRPKNSAPGEIPRDWLYAIRRDASAFAKKRSLVAARYSGRDDLPRPEFSAHELAVLSRLSQGRTAGEIAGELGISGNMAKSVIRSLYAALGASNRADAVRIATAKGLLQP
jgi:DNA-binding NarL/FixJ family response regulator